MKYNTLRIIRQLMEHELVVAEQQIDLLNEELKRLDPDGLLPETDARWGAPSFFDRLPAPQGLTVKDY